MKALPAVHRPQLRAGPAVARPSRFQLAAGRLGRSDLGFAALVLLAALVIAEGVASERWQYALTFAFVVTAAGLYVRWPTAGIAVLLTLWTFAAFFRRVLDYLTYSPPPDLLSLAPFLATAAIGLLAFRRARPTRRPLVVLGLVWAGLAIGVPVGLHAPLSVMYALFAYGSATLALLIGYADWKRGRLVVERILLVLLPLIAGYGLYQYFSPGLPPWDQLWLQTTGFITVGSKQAHNFRFFSVLNSPGALAGVLTLLIAMLICSRRLTPGRLLGASLALVCLVLIGVRSAWLGLAGALILITLFSGGRTLARLLVVPAVVLGGFYLVAGGTSAGGQVSNQVTTLGSLSQDKSFRDRLQAVTQYGPQGVAAPLGHGVGSVGQAAKLNTSGQAAPFADNGYLLILWQVGPLGFLLIIGAAGYAIVYGSRRTAGARLPDRLSLLGPLMAVVVVMASGDALYGVTAVIFWYFIGALFAASEASRPGAGGSAVGGDGSPGSGHGGRGAGPGSRRAPAVAEPRPRSAPRVRHEGPVQRDPQALDAGDALPEEGHGGVYPRRGRAGEGRSVRIGHVPCSRPVRVLYVQGAPDRAGAEAVLVGRLRHLAASGVEPVVASLAQGPFVDELRSLGVQVEVLASTPPRIRNPWRLPSMVRQIAATARRLDVDIIDGWGEKMSALAGWAARLADRPVVLTLHDAPRRSHAATAVQLAAVTARHDAVVVPSRWMADGFRRAWRLRAQVIPNGVAIETFPTNPAPVRADAGWPDDALVVGIFGRLVRWKGQQTFLHAARDVLAREPRARFLVVGGTLYGYETTYADELRRTATELGLADHVWFTGHRADQLELILACDVVCHASLDPEPFGLVVAEAMALGRPVIATRTGGPEEIVAHGRTGLLVPPGDQRALAEATLRLLGDQDLRRRLGDAAQTAARTKYDAARVTPEVAALYRRLTGCFLTHLAQSSIDAGGATWSCLAVPMPPGEHVLPPG